MDNLAQAVSEVPQITPYVILTAVIVPVTIAVVKLIEKWIPSKTDHMENILTGYSATVSSLQAEVTRLSTGQQALAQAREEDRAEIEKLKSTSGEKSIRFDRVHRIAYRAIDRVEDHQAYLTEREQARFEHDPDYTKTPWVPEVPDHLRVADWVERYRGELDRLNEPLVTE